MYKLLSLLLLLQVCCYCAVVAAVGVQSLHEHVPHSYNLEVQKFHSQPAAQTLLCVFSSNSASRQHSAELLT